MFNKVKFILSFVVIVSLLACNRSETDNKNINAKNNSQENITNNFTSKAGEINIPKNIDKIVALDGNSLNTLDVLGADDKIIAVAKSITLTKILEKFNNEKYTNVGSPIEPNIEAISSLKPNLIIMFDRMAKYVDQLKKIAPVYYFSVDEKNFYESFKEENLKLASIIGKENEAKDLITKIDDLINQLKEKTKGKTALMLMVSDKKLLTFGLGSRFTMVYDTFGFTPIDEKIESKRAHGNQVSFEYLLKKNPDYLIVLDRSAAISQKTEGAKRILNNNIIKQTKAYKNNHIIYVNPTNWYLVNLGLGGFKEIVEELIDKIE